MEPPGAGERADWQTGCSEAAEGWESWNGANKCWNANGGFCGRTNTPTRTHAHTHTRICVDEKDPFRLPICRTSCILRSCHLNGLLFSMRAPFCPTSGLLLCLPMPGFREPFPDPCPPIPYHWQGPSLPQTWGRPGLGCCVSALWSWESFPSVPLSLQSFQGHRKRPTFCLIGFS